MILYKYDMIKRNSSLMHVPLFLCDNDNDIKIETILFTIGKIYHITSNLHVKSVSFVT